MFYSCAVASRIAANRFLLDSGATGRNERDFWEPILVTTGDEEGYELLFDDIRGSQVEEYLSVRAENSNSIVNCVRTARETAAQTI